MTLVRDFTPAGYASVREVLYEVLAERRGKTCKLSEIVSSVRENVQDPDRPIGGFVARTLSWMGYELEEELELRMEAGVCIDQELELWEKAASNSSTCILVHSLDYQFFV